MFKKSIFCFFSFFICGEKKEENWLEKCMIIVPLNKYLYNYNLESFFKDNKDPYNDIRYYIQANKGFLEIEMSNFFISFFSHITNFINMNYLKSLDQTKLDTIKNIMASTNEEGFEDLLGFLEDFNKKEKKIIIYMIVPIEDNKNNMDEINYILNNPRVNVQALMENFCLYPYVQIRKKKTLNICQNCKKKEITNILGGLSNGEKGLFFLKTFHRYVLIYKIKEEIIENVEIDQLKKIYIKNGLSLITSKEKKIKAIQNIIHNFYCR